MSYDSWRNDMLEHSTPGPALTLEPEPELPRYLAELRDGTAPPHVNQGAARKRRLEQMQHHIIACDDFVGDLDRLAQHLVACPPPYVGTDVADAINAWIVKRREQIVDKKQRLHEELIYLRSVS